MESGVGIPSSFPQLHSFNARKIVENLPARVSFLALHCPAPSGVEKWTPRGVSAILELLQGLSSCFHAMPMCFSCSPTAEEPINSATRKIS